MKPVGVAIIAYRRLEDARRAVRSVLANTRYPFRLLVFDNSDDFRIGSWMLAHANSAMYRRSPYNCGTCLARNEIMRVFCRMGMDYWVVMDQDVEVVAPGWVKDMLDVFKHYPDTGIVGWRNAVRSAGCPHAPDNTGRMPEIPGVCTMVSRKCAEAVNGWCARYFLHRGEDTDFCLAAATKGFATRVVMGPDKIAHHHPHRGVQAFAGHGKMWSLSDAILKERTEKLGFERIPGINA